MTPEQRETLATQIEGLFGAVDENNIADYHAVLKILGFRHPWKDSNTGWANVLDQVLHMTYVMVVLLPIVVWPSYAGVALTALLFALIREYEQWKNWDWKLLLFWNRTLDVISFVAGGLLLYFLAQTL
jgi:general stress protein CsbA